MPNLKIRAMPNSFRNNGFKNKKYTSFNSSDLQYIDCGNGVQYEWNEPQSYIVVFKITTAGYGYIYTKGGVSAKLAIREINGKFKLYIYQDVDNNIQITTTDNFADDKWHILIITNDGSPDGAGVNFYVDTTNSRNTDVLLHGSITGSILNGYPNIIGCNYNQSAFFEGALDEVTLVSRKLSTSDIVKIIGNQSGDFDPTKMGDIKKIVDSNLGALWHLGDKATFNGSQWIYPNQNKNGNNGISQGMDITNVKEH